jgi:hypothetical protein
MAPVQGQQRQQRLDVQKIREIRAKQRRGEALTAEEKAYWKRAVELRRKRTEAYKKAHPPRESTGLVPLNELGEGTYKGSEGGLYPGGGNTPPGPHLKAGRKLAKAIAPLNRAGEPSPEGKIVLLSLGMSNTTQEFQVFKKLADADPEKNPRLVIVDGAQGGQSAEVTADPGVRFWRVIDQRLEAAGVTRKQVQVAWMKQAIQRPSASFPKEVKVLQSHLLTNLHILADRFPNLRITYLSNRIYAGYAVTPLNPEPHSYESGFAVKWLIADQMAGRPELNYDPKKGKVNSPWLAWGPYLWADGTKARSDGLVYLREDLAQDGTHPSMSGREKVAKLLLSFLRTDPTARPWFVKRGHR